MEKPYDVTCTRTYVITVSAETEDEAEDLARNTDWDNYPVEIDVAVDEVPDD